MPSPTLIKSSSLQNIFEDSNSRRELADALAVFLESQRWYAAKTATIQSVDILDSVEIAGESASFELILVSVTSNREIADCYALPISSLERSEAGSGNSVIARFASQSSPDAPDSLLVECSGQPEFWKAITTVLAEQPLTTTSGRELKLSRTACSQFADAVTLHGSSFTIHSGEQSNSAVSIGDDFFLKLFRRPRVGQNPDAEIGIFLTDRTEFRNSPRVDATIDISGDDGSRCLALISEQVPATADAWTYTLRHLKDYWTRLADLDHKPQSPPQVPAADSSETPKQLIDLIGDFRLDALQLGRRTAELHSALSSHDDDADFAPEPLTRASLNQLVDLIRSEVKSTCNLLKQANGASASDPRLPQLVSERANKLLDNLSSFDVDQANVVSIRCHGDYHLGQVLRTTTDFVILDFEGEPDRPFDQRRQKRCAMKDVAGMIRSLHYASCAAAVGMLPLPDPSISNPTLWQKFWFDHASAGFLDGYRQAAEGRSFLPANSTTFRQLLDCFLLEKVLYELRYEINNRPDWVQIPLAGLNAVLGL